MKNFNELSARTSFAALTTEFAMQTRTLSRSRAFRSKRHADGASHAYKRCLFQNSSFCWSRKELENFEFRKNSKFELDSRKISFYAWFKSADNSSDVSSRDSPGARFSSRCSAPMEMRFKYSTLFPTALNIRLTW